jgi:RimJ/RimL family protein N-acetyltransferase
MLYDAPQTSHLTIEPLNKAHYEPIYALCNDSEVQKTLGGGRSEEEVRAHIDHVEKHWREHGYGVWVMWTRDIDPQFVGRIGLMHTQVDGKDEVELLYAIMPEFWGKGLVVEAANVILDIALGDLLLPSVVAFTLPENTASRRVMEKLDFEYEKDIEHAGMPHVLYRLSLD